METLGIETGERCNRDGCTGVIEEHEKGGCSCHINPPCSSCTEPRAYCPVCGWDEKEETDAAYLKASEARKLAELNSPVKTPAVQPAKEPGTVIENEVCKLRILHNPDHRPQHANVYYRVELLSGVWPEENLVTICDNGKFGGTVCHFGGRKSIGKNTAEVTVYVD